MQNIYNFQMCVVIIHPIENRCFSGVYVSFGRIFFIAINISNTIFPQAYVVFIQLMGSSWLERNLTVVLGHVLDLVANPKAASSHVDAVYARKCINFILRSVLGRMLPEKAQIAAVKEMTLIVAKQMTSIGTLCCVAITRLCIVFGVFRYLIFLW